MTDFPSIRHFKILWIHCYYGWVKISPGTGYRLGNNLDLDGKYLKIGSFRILLDVQAHSCTLEENGKAYGFEIKGGSPVMTEAQVRYALKIGEKELRSIRTPHKCGV